MSQIAIDKGVPMPKRYPFAEMDVGDSFVVPPNIARTTVAIAALRYSRKHGVKFVVRLTPDRTLRCWRVQ